MKRFKSPTNFKVLKSKSCYCRPSASVLCKAHRSRLHWQFEFIFQTGSTLKRRNALAPDFTWLTHFYFNVALNICLQFLHLNSNLFLASVNLQPFDHCESKINLFFYFTFIITSSILCINWPVSILFAFKCFRYALNYKK